MNVQLNIIFKEGVTKSEIEDFVMKRLSEKDDMICFEVEELK